MINYRYISHDILNSKQPFFLCYYTDYRSFGQISYPNKIIIAPVSLDRFSWAANTAFLTVDSKVEYSCNKQTIKAKKEDCNYLLEADVYYIPSLEEATFLTDRLQKAVRERVAHEFINILAKTIQKKNPKTVYLKRGAIVHASFNLANTWINENNICCIHDFRNVIN